MRRLRRRTGVATAGLLTIGLVCATPGTTSAVSDPARTGLPDRAAVPSGPLLDPVDVALDHLRRTAPDIGLARADVAELVTASAYRSAHSGVTHVNLGQRHDGLEVFGGYATVNVDADGKVVYVGESLVKGLETDVVGTADEPGLGPVAAVRAAADALELPTPTNLYVRSRDAGTARETVVSSGGVSEEPIPVRLGWQHTRQRLRLAWQLVIDDSTDAHLWNATIDAETGELLRVDDWTDHDGLRGLASTLDRPDGRAAPAVTSPDPVDDGSSYRVFALPTEGPNDGGRTLVADPADATSSPFGWHDTDGTAGAEFTTTQGNNVHAYTDRDADDTADPSSDPDGDSALTFDFPLDLAEHPQTYSDAATTNLFYWINIVHDVTYRYGFDEAAGNFQASNYGRGGIGGDFVRAEAVDGSGENNANFSTPPVDGAGEPRMQMYLWPGRQLGLPNAVTVGAGSAAGSYPAEYAAFTPAPTVSGSRGDIVVVDDGSASPTLGCGPLAGFPTGAIALVDRGVCSFEVKVRNAEAAGAAAVIVANNSSSRPPVMTGTMHDPVQVPAVMISQADGEAIRAGLPGAGRVHRNPDRPAMRDGDLDAGIVIHEYGHGLSNRLTGGPTVNCLTGNEQAGEGWSDWLALVMLLDAAVDDPDGRRGMGTYATYEDGRTGAGIRPAPYSRDMAVQPFTYDSIKTRGWLDETSLALPHGLGHGWAAVLWDVTWDLIDKHGFNPDIYAPWDTGGNNRALQYVIDGLKFQGCSPGLVDARDAIIAAADTLSDGADTCTLWASFARRGLGYSAVQGTTNRNDNTEAFDTHPDCRADFSGQTAAEPMINSVNRGSAVPLRFTLGGNHGLDILAENSPFSRQVDCTTLAVVSENESIITPRALPIPTQTPGRSRLSYDRKKDTYTYPWKTRRDWAGTCRELVLTRDDGVQHRAYFHFTPTAPPAEPPAVSRVWEVRHNGPGNGGDYPGAMSVSPDGSRVYVTGMSDGDGTAQDYATVAYDADTGEPLWSTAYDGPAGSTDEATALGVSPDGSRVYVTGRSIGEGRISSGLDYATVAYDATTGEELWATRYDGPGNNEDVARALGISPDGATVFVTGESQSGSSIFTRDYATLAYDAATGEELWSARHNGDGNNIDAARSLGMSPDGSTVFVTGESRSGSSFGTEDYATVAYDATTGAQRWATRNDGPGNGIDSARDLGVSPDGDRVFVTGQSAGDGTGADYATVAYDATTGEAGWTTRYDGPGSGSDGARALDVSPDGDRVFVTGPSSGDGTGADYATLAYDAATGAETWAARYDGPANFLDEPAALSVSPDGSRVYVTGYSDGGGASTSPVEGYDFATFAYDAATGDQLWLARYDSPARDADGGEAIAVSPDGARVFVSGQSLGVGTGADYATVAYEPLE